MLGILFIIAAQLAFAIGSLFLKKLTADTDPLLATATMVVMGAISLSPILLHFSHDFQKLVLAPKMLWAALAGIFIVGIGEVCYTYGISKTPLSNLGLLSLFFPLFTALLGYFFLGETLGTKEAIAAMLIIAGYMVLVT